jgi:hypothetical protein
VGNELMNQVTDLPQLELQLKETQDAIKSLKQDLSVLTARFDTNIIKVEVREKEGGAKFPSLSGVIKDELFFISSLILFVGIISTETYYHYFGVKYQFLNLPIFHIIYRGLTAIIASPALLFPYLATVAWLILDGFAVRQSWSWFLRFQRPLAYLLMLLILLVTYPLARRSGRAEAQADLRKDTSSLSTILRLDAQGFTDKEILENEYRLLMVDSDYVIFFKPLARGATQSVPVIHRLPKGEVHVLDTN